MCVAQPSSRFSFFWKSVYVWKTRRRRRQNFNSTLWLSIHPIYFNGKMALTIRFLHLLHYTYGIGDTECFQCVQNSVYSKRQLAIELAGSTQFNQVQSCEFFMKTSLFFHTHTIPPLKHPKKLLIHFEHTHTHSHSTHGWMHYSPPFVPNSFKQDSMATMIYIMDCWKFYNRVERWIT